MPASKVPAVAFVILLFYRWTFCCLPLVGGCLVAGDSPLECGGCDAALALASENWYIPP